MRNPERIPKVLEAIESFWRLSPDLRFGQVVSLIQAMNSSKHSFICTEDEEILLSIIKLKDRFENPKQLNNPPWRKDNA